LFSKGHLYKSTPQQFGTIGSISLISQLISLKRLQQMDLLFTQTFKVKTTS